MDGLSALALGMEGTRMDANGREWTRIFGRGWGEGMNDE